ncbi:alpha-L-fucosidase [Flavitalea sp. BT771]|uniref:alpha-L-fucosidase n=1 Tax=Flavitalea sp. BT771 TaxID=3063329 RepID=UPI0026E32FD9|nr:alpha-L-fucosidase [Flavitalea sp. BT771]MDO6430079.1 alpha-L-fucosidase [Flavitalea sp. BT771]MDV6219782.1 alpha-L-fucosidase [Flavitalea sp. BT771]
MRKYFLILSLIIVAHNSFGQVVVDSSLLLSQKDIQWWKGAKFGLFIHFGLYSVLGQGEWAMFERRMDTSEYGKLKDSFTVSKFSGKNWVDVAKQAGCKYMVVTSRHHDGFSLFNTSFGNYNSMNTPAKKDLIKEYVDAAHNAGMKVGIYYSPLDWRYPGFFFPDLYYSNALEMKKQTYTQVRELLSNYGKIDILWYDGGEDSWLGFAGLMWDGGKGWYTRGMDKPYRGKFSWEPIKLNTMVRELQPKVVINPRSGWMGDFNTQEVRLRGRENRPWELCTNLSNAAWGWTPSAKDNMMTLDSCIRLLVAVVCQDGNLLLNVGPKADGEIEPAQVQRLKEMGDFLSKYGESIYNTRGGVWDANWGGTTFTDNEIYVHVLRVPTNGRIILPSVSKKITSVKYLGTNVNVGFKQSEGDIVLDGISNKENKTDIILKATLK